MTGYPRPGLATRLAAAFHSEVGAATVEAYRRAGAAAYSDQADAERVRSELVLSGRTIWTALLGEVEHWSARARAACDETYDVTAEVTVPAPLPLVGDLLRLPAGRRRVRPASGVRPVPRLQPGGLQRPRLGRMRQ